MKNTNKQIDQDNNQKQQNLKKIAQLQPLKLEQLEGIAGGPMKRFEELKN